MRKHFLTAFAVILILGAQAVAQISCPSYNTSFTPVTFNVGPTYTLLQNVCAPGGPSMCPPPCLTTYTLEIEFLLCTNEGTGYSLNVRSASGYSETRYYTHSCDPNGCGTVNATFTGIGPGDCMTVEILQAGIGQNQCADYDGTYTWHRVCQ